MSNLKSFVVIKSTASKNGGFMTKLQHKSIVATEIEGLGKVYNNHQETYFMKTEAQAEVNKEIKLPLDRFNIVERDYMIPEGDNVGEIIKIKQLIVKA
jgi:hypothetical protein